MDVMSGPSPSSSVSPPISPIKLFNQPGTGLPPLKNLPVWNRTGLEKNRFIRSITKDSPEIGNAELVLSHFPSKSTQTSPPGTAYTNMDKCIRGKNRLISSENSAIVDDKNLYFVQSEHEGVLRKLHLELDNLKNQNRDLTFKLVMTKNGISVSPDIKDARDSAKRRGDSSKSRHHSSLRKQSMGRKVDERRDSFSKEDGKRQKASYMSAGSKTSQATENGTLKTSFRSAKQSQHELRSSQRQPSSKIVAVDAPSKSHEINEEPRENRHEKLIHTQPHLDASREDTKSTLITGKEYSPEDYEDIIRNLKRLNAKQASELSHLKEKLIEQRGRTDDSHLPSPNRLPKLDIRNTSKSAKMPTVIRGKHQIVSLPALKPILGSKMTNRQRKAQASHVQRQRSNKDIAQKLV